MSLDDITNDLARIRDELARHYQLNGMTDDQQALAEAIACVSSAEERLRTQFSATTVA